MAPKKQARSPKGARTPPSTVPTGAGKPPGGRAAKRPPEGGIPSAEGRCQSAAAARPPTGDAAAGLDAERHGAAQRAAHGADLLRQRLFPTLMSDALAYASHIDAPAYRVFLDRLMEDAGKPTDPVQCMLLEQLALAHFRVGQLQASAASSQSLTAVKIYNSLAARLMGEFRRTALAHRVFTGRVPGDDPRATLKVFKQAQ